MRKIAFFASVVFVVLGLVFASPCLAQPLSEQEKADLISDCQGLNDLLTETNIILTVYIDALIVRCDDFDKRAKLLIIKNKVEKTVQQIEKQKASLLAIKNLPPESAHAKAALKKNFENALDIFLLHGGLFVAAGYVYSPEEGLGNKEMIEGLLGKTIENRTRE